MPALSDDAIASLIAPYFAQPESRLIEQLSVFLDLLLKWNAKTNLTAIRDPAEIVKRHFGESLFVAAHVPPGAVTLLDLGSGAGFPVFPSSLRCRSWRLCSPSRRTRKLHSSGRRSVPLVLARVCGQLELKPCRQQALSRLSPCGPWTIRRKHSPERGVVLNLVDPCFISPLLQQVNCTIQRPPSISCPTRGPS